MAMIDTEREVVVIRIVYDGPPLSGKTTSVCNLGNILGKATEVFSPGEYLGRTLYFDWMEYVGGFFKGYRISCQVVSVPGQISLKERREFLLHSADVVVFVIDASQSEKETTLKYFKELQAILSQQTEHAVKVVIQANKQDKVGALSVQQLRELFNDSTIKIIESTATESKGLRETFVLAVRLAMERTDNLMQKGKLPVGRTEIGTGQDLFASLQQTLLDANKTEDYPLSSVSPELPEELIEAEKASEEFNSMQLQEDNRFEDPPLLESDVEVSEEELESVSQEIKTIVPLQLDEENTRISKEELQLALESIETPVEEPVQNLIEDDTLVSEEELELVLEKYAASTQEPVEEFAIEDNTQVSNEELELALGENTIDENSTLILDDNIQVSEEELELIADKENLVIIEEMDLSQEILMTIEVEEPIKNQANKPESKKVLKKRLPKFPDEYIPTQWIWPPLLGREMLNHSFKHTIKPRLQNSEIWTIFGQGWRCFSKTNWHYDNPETARDALRCHIALHLQCSPILLEQRCLAMWEAEKNDWYLWQILHTAPTLAEQLNHVLQGNNPDKFALELFKCAKQYADLYRNWANYPVELKLTLDNIGVNESQESIYLGSLDKRDMPIQQINDDLLAEVLKQAFTEPVNHALQRMPPIKSQWNALERIHKSDKTFVLEALAPLFK